MIWIPPSSPPNPKKKKKRSPKNFDGYPPTKQAHPSAPSTHSLHQTNDESKNTLSSSRSIRNVRMIRTASRKGRTRLNHSLKAAWKNVELMPPISKNADIEVILSCAAVPRKPMKRPFPTYWTFGLPDTFPLVKRAPRVGVISNRSICTPAQITNRWMSSPLGRVKVLWALPCMAPACRCVLSSKVSRRPTTPRGFWLAILPSQTWIFLT